MAVRVIILSNYWRFAFLGSFLSLSLRSFGFCFSLRYFGFRFGLRSYALRSLRFCSFGRFHGALLHGVPFCRRLRSLLRTSSTLLLVLELHHIVITLSSDFAFARLAPA